MQNKRDVILDVDQRPTPGHWLGLSLQHMFSMFGSTVLVPILVGLNPGIALFVFFGGRDFNVPTDYEA